MLLQNDLIIKYTISLPFSLFKKTNRAMKKLLLNTFNFLIITLFFVSCQNEKSNETLNKFKLDNYQYKKELSKIMNDSTVSATYFFENYFTKNNAEYLTIRVETTDSEAFIDVKILKWDSITSKIKEFKGKGYGGSEFKNLKLNIVDDGKDIEFVYMNVDEIVD